MKNIMYNFALFILSISMIQAQDTMEVDAGWNMIGAKSTIEQSELRSEPPDIITSSYYGYKSGIGYSQAETLKDGKGYWVKASEEGIIIGGATSDSVCGSSTVEYAGKTYNTVQIGSQCWLKENLDVGTMLTGSTNSSDNSIIEKYCYNDSASNCDLYGGLYQWNEAMQYSTTPGTQGICPPGWHIPTYAELQTLGTTVSNDGNALKAVGQGTGGGAGTNTSGFSALLSGYRYDNGTFYGIGDYTYFWSSTESIEARAYYLYLVDNSSGIYLYYDFKSYGFSVRCVED